VSSETTRLGEKDERSVLFVMLTGNQAIKLRKKPVKSKRDEMRLTRFEHRYRKKKNQKKSKQK